MPQPVSENKNDRASAPGSLDCGYSSKQGVARARNEDSCGIFLLPNGDYLAVVADGMGGSVGGAEASKIAMNTLVAKLGSLGDNPLTSITEAYRAAQEAILKKAESEHSLEGMGTTASIALYHEEKLYIASLGDTRIYHFNEKVCEQLSEDHSLVQELVRTGRLSPEKARNHPRSSVITRALGAQMRGAPDMYSPITPEEGDVYVICTDGIWGSIEDSELQRLALESDAETAVERMVDTAAANNSKDDRSVAIIRFVTQKAEIESTEPPRGPRQSRRAITILTAAAGLAAIVLGLWFFLSGGDDTPLQEIVRSESKPDKGTSAIQPENTSVLSERNDKGSAIKTENRNNGQSQGSSARDGNENPAPSNSQSPGASFSDQVAVFEPVTPIRAELKIDDFKLAGGSNPMLSFSVYNSPVSQSEDFCFLVFGKKPGLDEYVILEGRTEGSWDPCKDGIPVGVEAKFVRGKKDLMAITIESAALEGYPVIAIAVTDKEHTQFLLGPQFFNIR